MISQSRPNLLAGLFLLLSVGFVCAQPAVEPPAGATPVSLDDLTRTVTEILDELDARWGEPPSREELDRLNELVLRIQAADPASERVQYLYGRAWALMGRTGAAISSLQKYVDSRDGRNEWKAFRVLGDLFVDEFPRMALSNYEKAAALKPDEPTVLLGMSRGYHGVGERDKALDYAKRAVMADRGRYVRPVGHLAKMFAANQQWSEADRTAMAALEKAQAQLQAEPGRRGALILLQEQYDLLIGMLRTRLAAPGAGSDQYARLGRFMRERADTAAKLALYDVLSVINVGLRAFQPASADLLLEQAITLAELDRRSDAIEVFEKVLSLDPDNSTAKDWLSRLRASTSAAATTLSRP